MAKISFDFDNCLSTEKVQFIAKELVKEGHEVFIVTSRFEPLRRLKYKDLKDNRDIYEVADRVGIPPYRIAYTNQQKKWIELNQSGIHIHIDDDKTELESLAYYGIVKGFNNTDKNFEKDLFNYLELIEKF